MASLENQNGVLWMDGNMVPWQEAKTHVLTHTLHYGVGIFEGLRAYKTEKGYAIFRLQEHTDRFFDSAKIMRIELPFDKETLNQAQIEMIRQNDFDGADSIYLRPMAFYGADALGIHSTNTVHVIVGAWVWGAYLGREKLEQGVKIGVSSYRRNHVNSIMCKAKTNGNYVNSVLAARDAHDQGFDEALLLDHQGYVAEGSGQNFFIVRRHRNNNKLELLTPGTDAILEGITRDTILQLAADQGYATIQKNITRDEVYVAEEAFFTGSAAEVTPIRSVDQRIIGGGSRGDVTKGLQEAYFDVVHGRNERYDSWLTYV